MKERRTFAPQHRNVRLRNRSDEGVVYRRVLVSQLIAEIDDPPRMRNGVEGIRCRARERRDGFAHDDELMLDRGANEPVGLVRSDIQPARGACNRVARINDISELSTLVTRHRAAASCARCRGRCKDS